MGAQNIEYLGTLKGLTQALQEGKTLTARAIVCDTAHNLVIDLGNGLKGLIPRPETGIDVDEEVGRDPSIITRIGRGVSFKVTSLTNGGPYAALLSRKKAQEEYLSSFLTHRAPGDIIDARITHLANFGAFADIGLGISALIFIDHISVSRIEHPKERFTVGQDMKAVVKEIEPGTNRIFLSHKELLGTWEENAAAFSQGQTVMGIARSVEPYGIFVELSPNLTGLAEFRPDVHPRTNVSVYIKNIIPEKMKFKLIIIDTFDSQEDPLDLHYFLTQGHMDRFLYSPPSSGKVIETVF